MKGNKPGCQDFIWRLAINFHRLSCPQMDLLRPSDNAKAREALKLERHLNLTLTSEGLFGYNPYSNFLTPCALYVKNSVKCYGGEMTDYAHTKPAYPMTLIFVPRDSCRAFFFVFLVFFFLVGCCGCLFLWFPSIPKSHLPSFLPIYWVLRFGEVMLYLS